MLRIIKDTSIYALGDILTKGIGFFAIVFYTHFLSINDIGVYGYFLIIIGFVNTFLILGVDNAYARYFFEYEEFKQKQVLTTTLFLFLLVWIISVLILPLLLADDISLKLFKSTDYDVTFILALLSLPLKLLSSMSNQALRNQFKTKQFIIYNFVTAFVSVCSAILLLSFFDFGVGSIFLGMIIADVLVLPFRIGAIKDLFTNKIDFSILKKILLFGIPFLPASIAYWVFSSADRVMLESMCGLDSVGIYTVAVSLSAVMSIIASAIGQAWSPHAVKAYENDKEKAKLLYKKIFNLLVFLALFVLVSIALVGKEIISFIFPTSYDNLFYPMLLLLSAIGFQITTQVTAVAISLAKKTIYIVYITFFIALFNIGMNYLLIPNYGEVGASFATMFSYMLLTFIYALVSQKLFKIDYNIKIIVLSLMFLILIFIISFLNLYFRFGIFAMFLVILYMNRIKFLKVVI